MDTVTFRRPCETADFSFVNDCLVRLRQQRKLIYAIAAGVFILATGYVAVKPIDYIATAKVIPFKNNSVSSIPGSFLPMVGVFSEAAAQVDLYLELLKSNQLQKAVQAACHQESALPVRNESSPVKATFSKKTIGRAVAATSFTGNYKSGVVQVTCQTTSPELSQRIANTFIDQLDLGLQKLDQRRAGTINEYLTNEVDDQREKLLQTEQKKIDFLAVNRNYLVGDDPGLRMELSQVEMNLEFNRRMLLTLLELKATNDLELEKNVPRLTVIDWADLPLPQSWSTLVWLPLVITMGATLFMMGLVALRVAYSWYIPSTTRQELGQSYAVLNHDARAAASRLRHPFKIVEPTEV